MTQGNFDQSHLWGLHITAVQFTYSSTTALRLKCQLYIIKEADYHDSFAEHIHANPIYALNKNECASWASWHQMSGKIEYILLTL